MGSVIFVKLLDRSGDIQLFIRKNGIGNESFNDLKKLLDVGDHIGATGRPMTTKKGEPSISVSAWRMITKALRPLPEKWHGLKDAELRYRRRYLDLVANRDVADVFRKRAKIVATIRRCLDERDFLEVETPQLQALATGAAARPFKTHHNALDMELYLRIAPELYLKRLLVGGYERVYEIGRNFRNEGISTQHNPEFTMLEFYQAYATYEDLMRLTEEMVAECARAVQGRTQITYQGEDIDLTPPWTRMSVREAVQKETGVSDDDLSSLAATVRFAAGEGGVPYDLLRDALRFGGCPDPGETKDTAALVASAEAGEGDPRVKGDSLGLVLMALFEERCEHRLRQPTFITDYPLANSPLSRKKDSDPSLVDRFELFITGREMANAFSELNDPRDQADRFQAQLEARDRGDAEAMEYDRDYVRALEHGMPPAAGEGIGIDRLCMLLCDCASIRDVILFPLMRPSARRDGTGVQDADDGDGDGNNEGDEQESAAGSAPAG